jgi:hypothetical protein
MRWHASLLILLLAGCAYPNIGLQQPARAAVVAESVSLITDEKAASAFNVLGRAWAWSNVPVSRRKGYDTAVKRLRERAASVGAEALWVPAPEQIYLPAVQQRWMERTEGWQRDWRGGEAEYVTPHELMGVLLVRP